MRQKLQNKSRACILKLSFNNIFNFYRYIQIIYHINAWYDRDALYLSIVKKREIYFNKLIKLLNETRKMYSFFKPILFNIRLKSIVFRKIQKTKIVQKKGKIVIECHSASLFSGEKGEWVGVPLRFKINGRVIKQRFAVCYLFEISIVIGLNS